MVSSTLFSYWFFAHLMHISTYFRRKFQQQKEKEKVREE
jgi:predicted alpha-1,6-mannanase (GH76 family)